MKIKYLLLVLMFSSLISAADLIKVLPITNKILVLEFKDGHIDYFGSGQDRYNGNKIYFDAFDKRGYLSENYLISSIDDSNYTTSVTPIAIGKKIKGRMFNNIYEPQEPKHTRLYWIYIELEHGLKRGNSYTIKLNDLASNYNEHTFVFSEFELRSPAVHVNQIGFVPEAPKYAYISHFMGDFNNGKHENGALDLSDLASTNFHLVNLEDNTIAFTGTISLQQSKSAPDFIRVGSDFTSNNMTRADVWECDFSSYSGLGSYKIVVEGIGSSYPFEIKEDIYREPFYYTMRAMFAQRAGIHKEIEPGFEFPRDHNSADGIKMSYYPDISNAHDFSEASSVGEIDSVWGWYHDAGDWDGYSHHYRVPMGLLALYDLSPEKFGDNEIQQKYKLSDTEPWINEGGNGIPDILDEAGWLINFYKRVKYALIKSGYSDGGVAGYAGVDAGADSKPAWDDKRDMSLQGGDIIEVTYRYAALAAWYAVCLNKSNGNTSHPQSLEWIEEAVDAYQWCVDKNKDSDDNNKIAKMEASAALFRATGEVDYLNDFKAVKNNSNWGGKLWFNMQPWHFAAITYSLADDQMPNIDLSLKQSIIDDIKSAALNETVNSAISRGYRYGTDSDIVFMLGTFSTTRTLLAAAAYKLTGEKKFLDVCYTTADYTLGGNQLNLVRVTRLGDEYENAVFHPNSFFTLDYNSKVYENPILPGFLTYDMHRNGDWQSGNQGSVGNGYSWIGDEDYSRSTVYPGIDLFPDAEARFHNRNSIAGSEFTIHQNNIQAIFGYGFLCDDYSAPYIPNIAPKIELNFTEGQKFPLDSIWTISVNASNDTRRVEYYYDWHFIGESFNKENDFSFSWDMSKYKLSPGTVLITAKAYDDKGMESKPSDEGDKNITIKSITSINEDDFRMGKFELKNNYPNPFNPSTTIEYEIPETTNVELAIYDILGRKIIDLVDKVQSRGIYTARWNGIDNKGQEVPSGIYFCNLYTSSFNENKKMCLLR